MQFLVGMSNIRPEGWKPLLGEGMELSGWWCPCCTDQFPIFFQMMVMKGVAKSGCIEWQLVVKGQGQWRKEEEEAHALEGNWAVL